MYVFVYKLATRPSQRPGREHNNQRSALRESRTRRRGGSASRKGQHSNKSEVRAYWNPDVSLASWCIYALRLLNH